MQTTLDNLAKCMEELAARAVKAGYEPRAKHQPGIMEDEPAIAKRQLPLSLLELEGGGWGYVPADGRGVREKEKDGLVQVQVAVRSDDGSAHWLDTVALAAKVKAWYPGVLVLEGKAGSGSKLQIGEDGMPATLTVKLAKPITEGVYSIGGGSPQTKPLDECISALGLTGVRREWAGGMAEPEFLAAAGVPTPSEADAAETALSALVGGGAMSAVRVAKLQSIAGLPDPLNCSTAARLLLGLVDAQGIIRPVTVAMAVKSSDVRDEATDGGPQLLQARTASREALGGLLDAVPTDVLQAAAAQVARLRDQGHWTDEGQAGAALRAAIQRAGRMPPPGSPPPRSDSTDTHARTPPLTPRSLAVAELRDQVKQLTSQLAMSRGQAGGGGARSHAFGQRFGRHANTRPDAPVQRDHPGLSARPRGCKGV